MLKLYAITLLLISIMSHQVFAQQDSSITSQVESFISPSVPAFTLLGVDPSVVEMPGSASDLTASVGNASNNFTEIPKNFAMELNVGRVLHGENMPIGRLEKPPVSDRFLLSFATTSDSTLSMNADNMLGAVGFRYLIKPGEIDLESLKKTKKFLENLNGERTSFVKKVRKNSKEYGDLTSIDNLVLEVTSQNIDKQKITIQTIQESLDISHFTPVLKAEIRGILNVTQELTSDSEVTKSILRINELLNEEKLKFDDRSRVVFEKIIRNKINQEEKKKILIELVGYDAAEIFSGLIEDLKNLPVILKDPTLQIAGAGVWELAGSDSTKSRIMKYGVWATYTHHLEDEIKFLMTGRYIANTLLETGALDLGGRLVYTPIERLNVSGEFALRHGIDTKSGDWDRAKFQFVMNAGFKINDDMIVTYISAREFADNGDGYLVNQVGITTSFTAPFTTPISAN